MVLTRLLFAVFVLCAFYGAGRILLRGVPGRHFDVPPLVPAPIIGAAFFIAVSGYIWLAGLATPPVIAGALGIFAVAACAVPFSAEEFPPVREHRTAVVTLGCVILPIIVFYIWLPPSFNGNDDGPAYYAFVRELATRGDLLAQPFSERRLFTLGGHFPLSALVDALFGPEGMSIVDPGLGLALVGALLVSLIVRGSTRTLAAAIVFIGIAAQLAVNSPIKNTVPVMLPFAFVLAMTSALLHDVKDRNFGGIEALHLGLLAAATISFRITVLPYVAVVCLLFLIQAPGLGAKLKMASIGAATLACALVPFMVLMFSSSGTPLFPVLGAGVHESAYQAASFAAGALHERLAHAVIASLLDPYILIAAGILAVRSLTFAKAGTLGWHWLVLIGFFIASVAVALSTGGVSFNRYTFAGTGSLAAALVITTSWRKPRQLIPTRFEGAAYRTLRTPIVLIAAIAVSAVVLVLATSTRVVSGVRNYAQQKIDFRYGAFRQSQAEENSFQAVAKLIPDGAHVLVSLSHAFLLPHANFTILFNDQPGRAGPPPFWPPSLDGRQTLKYLQDRGVDFLLVGSDFALPPPQAPGASLSQWDEKLRESGVWFARLVSSELSARTIYHDRFLRLIDLRP